ncbi:hypothetical protein SDC9_116401 [bioreactor metagenome]|uniref:Uncharacterized protein n=1 Tax=bioreactor metagenome TaxID=1076179 RepID=A0A645BVE2_9ZZZZ
MVFRVVNCLFEKVTPVFVLYTRVMAGNNAVASQHHGTLVQLVILHITVTIDTGIGRGPALVSGNKAVDDLGSEIVRKIENVIWHAEAICHAARVLGIVERTAGFLM